MLLQRVLRRPVSPTAYTVYRRAPFQLNRLSLCAPFCTRDPYEDSPAAHLGSAKTNKVEACGFTYLLLQYYVACLTPDIIYFSPVVLFVFVFKTIFTIDQFEIRLACWLNRFHRTFVNQSLLSLPCLIDCRIALKTIYYRAKTVDSDLPYAPLAGRDLSESPDFGGSLE